jgi:creatinine amidohydrolase
MAESTRPWGRYERLRPARIEEIRAAAPIAYVPWGALEWHSYHAPIGLDGMQAHGQCCALAERTGGVVLPAIYLGTDTIKPFKGFGHSIEHRRETVMTVARETLEQLAEEGFRVVVIVTGHAGGDHVDALRSVVEAAGAFMPAHRFALVPAFEPIQDTYPANHAARGETSFQLLFDPDTVDLTQVRPGEAPTLDEDGVWGEDPRGASAGEGEQMLTLFVDRTAPAVLALLEGIGGDVARDLPVGRQRYSARPPGGRSG